MSNKDEALRLADELVAPIGTQSTYSVMLQASDELRRLHTLAMDQQGQIYGLNFARETERKILNLVKAECDALREDAERYRWLRSDVATAENYPIACMRDGGWLLLGDELDAAIDAAREAGK